MFNKVWGAPSFLIAMVQALGCYCLNGSCRAPSLSWAWREGPAFPGWTACARRRTRLLGMGNPEIRLSRKIWSTGTTLCSPPPRPPSPTKGWLMPAGALGHSPGRAPCFLSLLVLERPAGTRPRPSQPEPAVPDHLGVSLSC